jgi:hypothetical protein
MAAAAAPTSPFSSFNSAQSSAEVRGMIQPTLAPGPIPFSIAPALYASPPISPFDSQSQKENINITDEQGSRDPQLFASGDATLSTAHVPLFPQDSQESAHQEAITRHMHSDSYVNSKVTMPTRQEYLATLETLTFVSSMQRQYTKDPKAWWIQERKYDQVYSNARKAREAREAREAQAKAAGIVKRGIAKGLAPAPSTRGVLALPRLQPRPPRVTKPKRTPKTQILHSFDSSPDFSSPKPPRQATSRDDTDYNSLPDYSPPLNTLPQGNIKVLKVDWKGTALDLENDPDRHLLHEAEVHLASILRLNCATYLCSKRRIFLARVEAMKKGKEFRKTDAQQACKIDVNKASKLWGAYEKVGWFRPQYFVGR